MAPLTQRERWQIVGVFGRVEFIIALVTAANWLVTGESSLALTAVMFLVAFASTPYIVPALWQEWKDIQLPPRKADDPSKTEG